jgi:hypothetical protein
MHMVPGFVQLHFSKRIYTIPGSAFIGLQAPGARQLPCRWHFGLLVLHLLDVGHVLRNKGAKIIEGRNLWNLGTLTLQEGSHFSRCAAFDLFDV